MENTTVNSKASKAMNFERILFEFGSFVVVLLASIAPCMIFPVGQLRLSFIPNGLLSPALKFSILPLTVYFCTRIYSLVSFSILSKLTERAPILYKPLAAASVIVALVVVAKQPVVYMNLQNLIEMFVGDIPEIVWKQGKPNREAAIKMGWKLLGLFGGWFIVLFVIERLCAGILAVIGLIVSMMSSSPQVKHVRRFRST